MQSIENITCMHLTFFRKEEKHKNNLHENQTISEKRSILVPEKTQETAVTPPKVAPVENSRTKAVFEEVASKTKSVCRLTMDYRSETCVICEAKGQGEWQVTQFDDSWGFLCGPCGLKLSEKLSNQK